MVVGGYPKSMRGVYSLEGGGGGGVVFVCGRGRGGSYLLSIHEVPRRGLWTERGLHTHARTLYVDKYLNIVLYSGTSQSDHLS